MSPRKFLVALIAAILVGAGVHAIADDATTAPSDESHMSHVRVGSPFNKLPDLTQEQTDKIKAIHAEVMEQEKQIRQKEHADIVALLTDDQKKELSDMEAADAKEAAEKKASSAENRAKTEEEKAQKLEKEAEGMGGGATTQPAGQ